MVRAIEIHNPPLFVLVTDPDGQRWLNAQRILSMREDKKGTRIDLDTGETFHVSERASVIAEYLQRPTVTIVRDLDGSDAPEKRSQR
jgi:hypothetical protein